MLLGPVGAETGVDEPVAVAPGDDQQAALGVVAQTMVETGRLSWREVAARMSEAPARIGRLETHGRPLEVGQPANLVVIDPAVHWTVDPRQTASRSRNTPFAGRELPTRIRATFLRGLPTAIDGKMA